MPFRCVFLGLVFLAGCASTTVTPVSKNEFMLDTSAAPACGRSGAAKVAAKMAAVETLRAGYDGYIIVGMQSENDVQVVQTAPTGAITNSTFSGYGNTVYGQSNTTFTGGGPLILGDYNQTLMVRMFKRSDEGFSNAVDARSFLGAEWAELVESGVRTCG